MTSKLRKRKKHRQVEALQRVIAAPEHPGLFELEDEFMRKRYAVSDEELLARTRAAPDNGGATLVELCSPQDEAPLPKSIRNLNIDELQETDATGLLRDAVDTVKRAAIK